MKNYTAGDTVSFTLFRDQQLQTIEVTLDESNVERSQAMTELQQSFQEAQQRQQQQQQQSNTWPFEFFGW